MCVVQLKQYFRGNFLALNAFQLFKVSLLKSKDKIQLCFVLSLIIRLLSFVKYAIYSSYKILNTLKLKKQKTLNHCEKVKP